MRASIALVLPLLLTLSGGPAWAAPAQGITLIPRGGVEVRASEQGQWDPVSARTPLPPGSEVRTAPATGAAELDFTDGSKLLLSPGSHFAVERSDSKESSFSLKVGKLRAVIAGFMSGRVKIHTPTATAAVRGTVFDISAAAGGSSEVNVAEGHLEVQDNKGQNAVVTSEETVTIGADGMEPPRQVALTDERAQPAARPAIVAMELGRDNARKMIEELRNRELKANEAQLGKDVIDAFGKRVRLEEYVLRPANNEFKLVFISHREDTLDWGHLLQRFNGTIPDDLTQIPKLFAASFMSASKPANWVKYTEVYLTNTIDAVKETISYGDPVQINFAGFGAGLRWYPASIDYQQILAGPGVPGGQRTQFQLSQNYGTEVPGQFAWTQRVWDNTDTFNILTHVSLDPSNAADVANGLTSVLAGDRFGDPNIDPGNATITYPSGQGKADFEARSDYKNGSWLTSRKILVNDQGEVFDFMNPSASTFERKGSWNLELAVGSSFFQGRKIDVLIAPEILTQTKAAKTQPSNLNPG